MDTDKSKQITIHCQVSAADTARTGTTRYGTILVTPTAEEWAALPEASRRHVVNRGYERGYRDLAVPIADWPTIVAALATEIADLESRAEAERAERRARTEAALAAPDADWIADGVHGAPRVDTSPRGIYLDDEQRKDARIVARRELLALDVLPPLLVAYERAEAKRAEAERAEAERAEAYQAAIHELALRVDDLARAATDGYDVEGAVLDRLAKSLAERCRVYQRHVQINRQVFRNIEDRSAPGRAAFSMLDDVQAAVRGENEHIPVAVGRWVVSRIVRADVCPDRSHRHYVTVVLATLLAGDKAREVVVSHEPLRCPDHTDDDE